MKVSNSTPDRILKDVFGYDYFRPLQAEIISNVLKKRDTLVIMPTGSGKSICYQIPALIFEGLTIVVSPLISLMKDQVEQLHELGVQAAFLNSTLSFQEYNNICRRIVAGEIKLLYMAPEGLLTERTMNMLGKVRLDCLTIDEAHCISEWGHEFRPEYRKLVSVRINFPDAVCIALTATATPQVQKDIADSLKFESGNKFLAGYDRKNLFLQIEMKDTPVTQLVQFLRRHDSQSGIIYCFSRHRVDELSTFLAGIGYSVLPYHAGLDDNVRKQNQEKFIHDDVQIIVATIAFGMGINKPNVRFIVHYDVPKNIESYYQQIGRAGRDGLSADCLLLFGYGDLQKIRYFIQRMDDVHRQRIAEIHLDALVRLVETYQCRRKPLLQYFGQEYESENCGMCDNCVNKAQKTQDVTIAAQKFLSCVRRTGERFGAAHIIDVLRGSESQKIFDFNHHHLSTYGIGKEYTKKQWLFLSRQFISLGLLDKDAQYGGLKLTPVATDVLFHDQKVVAMLPEKKTEMRQVTKIKDDYDRILFEQLRNKRKQLADRYNVPPYAIFPDNTLIEMSSYFPQKLQNLLYIHGVGQIKLKKYGAIFLRIIQDHCNKNQITEKIPAKSILAPPRPKTARHILVGRAFAEGKSITELQEIFKIKKATAIGHLYNYVLEGNDIPFNHAIKESIAPPRVREAAFDFLHTNGTLYLKPMFDFFKGKIPYEELHILRVCYLCRDTGAMPK
ncbi:DNA helicase RecQ [candidate division KSB1 bacterium]|nr:DNA helicase RecQ [candidate division KSB1 bacterium]